MRETTPWLDGFTKSMLAVMILLLTAIFLIAKYMDAHHLTGIGTDDIVNGMAGAAARLRPHPFVDLPGDAQVGAFSVANFFAGLIVGHHWNRLFEVFRRRDEAVGN